jgi:hypothetical protein
VLWSVKRRDDQVARGSRLDVVVVDLKGRDGVENWDDGDEVDWYYIDRWESEQLLDRNGHDGLGADGRMTPVKY